MNEYRQQFTKQFECWDYDAPQVLLLRTVCVCVCVCVCVLCVCVCTKA